MAIIKEIKQLTENPYLNLYQVSGMNKCRKPSTYYVASRAKTIEALKITTKKVNADGVVIYALHGEKKDKVVLIRQYRYAINDYIYEFPAGLVDEGENYQEAAVRELKEETGLVLAPIAAPKGYESAAFTTIGAFDEACATVFGYASGVVSNQSQEENEEIEVILADKAEVKRILREEKLAIMCKYMLMHFVTDEDPFAFLKI